MTENMSYYDFMDWMDKFCLEYKDFDFRELTVSCNRVADVEIVYIKHKNDILETIVLNR